MATKTLRRWEQINDTKWVRKFGPFEVRVYRSCISENYAALADAVELDAGCTFDEIGDPYDDDADERALRLVEKRIKDTIRSWAK